MLSGPRIEHEPSEGETAQPEPVPARENTSAAHRTGFTRESEEPAQPGSSSPLRQRILKCKLRLRKLKHERRTVKRAQGDSLTLEQRRLFRTKIARRRTKLEQLKLLWTGQVDPPSPLHTPEAEGSTQSQDGVLGYDLTSVDPLDSGTEFLSGTREVGEPSGRVKKSSVGSARGLNFPIVDIREEESLVPPPVDKPSTAPYRLGGSLLKEILSQQRVDGPLSDSQGWESDAMHDVEEYDEFDDLQRDPDYDPDSGKGEVVEEPPRNDDSDDLFEEVGGYRREAPGNTPGGLLEVNNRGKVPRRPRNVAQSCEAVVTCPVPGCYFSGRNVRRHLRGQPHMFNDAQVERVINAGEGVRPRRRLYAHLACPLLGQVMLNEKVCTTKSTSRLDLHLPKHSLSRGTPQYA